MKKISLLFSILLITVFSVSLSACRSSDDAAPVDKKYTKKTFKSGEKVSYVVSNHDIPFRISFTVPTLKGEDELEVTHTPYDSENGELPDASELTPESEGALEFALAAGGESGNQADSEVLEGSSLDNALAPWKMTKDFIEEGEGDGTRWLSKISDFWKEQNNLKFTEYLVVSKDLTSTGKNYAGKINFYYGLKFDQLALGEEGALDLANRDNHSCRRLNKLHSSYKEVPT